jgi:Family of unknown function (DUF5330)
MGLMRKALFGVAVALALPVPPNGAADQTPVSPSASTMAYVSAAADTFADVRAFCSRRPQVCETASVVGNRIEAKAKYGARLIYEWANDASNPNSQNAALRNNEAEADPISTGTFTRGSAQPSTSQSTLSLQDLIPAWEGPNHKKAYKKS